MRKLLILTITALVLATVAIPGGLIRAPQSQAATASPTRTVPATTAAIPHSMASPQVSRAAGSTRALVPDPSTLKPCPAPTASPGSTPHHPPAPGDSFCDARRFGIPTHISPQERHGPRTAPTDPEYETLIAATDTVYGLYAARQVTNVQLASVYDTFYSTMHVYGSNGVWDEMSWSLWGTGLGLNHSCQTAPTINLFTYQSNDPSGAYCFPQYALSPGMYIYVDIVSDQNNAWSDYVYWNGNWNLIFDSILSSPYGVEENTDYEAYTDYYGSYLYIPDTYTENTEVVLCTASCAWNYWTPETLPDSYRRADEPYAVPQLTEWYSWYGCGPTATGSC